MLLLEYWLPVPGYNGIHASWSGKIRDTGVIVGNFMSGFRWSKPRILPFYSDKNGYKLASLEGYKMPKTVKVARIIAKTFIANPLKLPEVNHLNGIKEDNRVVNLEWTTRKGNMEHASKMGLLKGKRKKKSVKAKILPK